ncbi:H-NS family nucleoid-associated regulatory protein [Shewanella sp. SP1S1-7]|uniref:H-NS family histone-like protein n=1 Tax=Shewanella TaxID=22 RepID=UPI0028908923|nr:H-NS family nucleoid-associated regulatory protein [Shewanella sp. SP1S1-7]MDT3334129.1 H-NS family nucleoid-associated regulatory protein [Shewanella sp. SP1S1-7]
MSQANTITEKRAVALEILNNRNSIKGLFSDLHYEDVSKLVDRVNTVYNAIKELKEAEHAENEAKAAKIKEIQNSLLAQGLTLEDLAGQSQTLAKPRKKRVVAEQPEFTFEYTVDGTKKVYVGKATGNKPAELKKFLKDNFASLEDIIISADRPRYREFMAKKSKK